MAVRYDIQLTDSQDILFKDGDFVINQSDEQHIQDSINAFPGWWKQYPLDGVGIAAYDKGPTSRQVIAQKIQNELKADGYSLGYPSVTLDANGKLTINPNVNAI